jgi:hypothetical protein
MSGAKLPPALQRLSSMWDGVVRDFIHESPPWNEELQPWTDAYRGRPGATERQDNAIPEPFTGRLNQPPKAVLLALNPGQPFMGKQLWRGKQPVEDLQSRTGLFVRQIEENGGSYTKWAETPLDWPLWLNGLENPFVTSRKRFVRDWVSPNKVKDDEFVWFDLYPWHSKSWSSINLKNDAARELIDEFVIQPIAALSSPWTFAFGKTWFNVLRKLGFNEVEILDGADGPTWQGQTPSRHVGIFEHPNIECRVIAMYHSGGTGPPKHSETVPIREAVESRLRIG